MEQQQKCSARDDSISNSTACSVQFNNCRTRQFPKLHSPLSKPAQPCQVIRRRATQHAPGRMRRLRRATTFGCRSPACCSEGPPRPIFRDLPTGLACFERAMVFRLLFAFVFWMDCLLACLLFDVRSAALFVGRRRRKHRQPASPVRIELSAARAKRPGKIYSLMKDPNSFDDVEQL